ncbi:hypothetical protein UlMin_017062 [Ulmus minor]
MAIGQFLILFLFPALSSTLFALSETTVSENDSIRELQELKLKLAHLESKLEETDRNLNEKGLYLEEQENLIQQMSLKIHHLQSVVSSLKEDSSRGDERLKALEEEVQLLWAASRKNNFDIHILKSKAQDAEDRLEAVTSQAQKMADIVTERWIQIQQLEQAVHITQMRTLRARRIRYSRCTFLKFINKLFGDDLEKLFGLLDPYTLKLKKFFVVAQEYHHELQHFIKEEMEKHEFTALLANRELVFFMASALITFPILSAWMLLSSQLS